MQWNLHDDTGKVPLTTPPVHVVRGSDPVLVADALRRLVDDLVGAEDRSLVVDEISGDAYDLGTVVDAASTPPLFGDRRVVVALGAGRFSKADDVAPLVAYLAAPMATSAIVLVWELAPGQQRLAAVPKKLTEALDAGGGRIISTDPGTSRDAREAWWDDVFSRSPVRLTRAATALVRERAGEDISTVPGLLRLLEGAYGPGVELDVDSVEPFLGRAGGVPPWELTDAIDRGDTAVALDALHRMSDAGGRHPLQIMATLTSHCLRIARLSGADVRGERDAANLLGIKGSTFPAKKALASARTLGPDNVKRAIAFCAEADLQLRGGSVAWPGELVLEVLVARLCRLARGAGRRNVGRGAVSSRR